MKSFIKYSDAVRSRYYTVFKNEWSVFEINDEYLWFNEENFTRRKLDMVALKLRFGTGQKLEMFPVFAAVPSYGMINIIFFSYS